MICGYLFGWGWTGLPRSKVPSNTQPTKTLWDWLDLLIVPIVLAIGGYLFTRSDNQATREAAERRAQDEALQAYLDQVGQLLLDKDAPLQQSEEDSEVRTLARARTLTVLSRLDGDRKTQVVQFLYEAGLLDRQHHVLSLSGADLNGANLSGAQLSRANLGLGLFISGAKPIQSGKTMKTNLRRADLSGANLFEAILSQADLSEADLSGARIALEQLKQVASLEGATVP